jgi:hypothetical protein
MPPNNSQTDREESKKSYHFVKSRLNKKSNRSLDRALRSKDWNSLVNIDESY